MDIKITIPENLNEITLNQYKRWLKISEDNDNNNFIQQKMIEIFCHVPLKQVLQIKVEDMNIITETLSKMFDQKTKLINRFTYNDIEFGFIPKLDDMTFGEYVDLDTYLNDWQQMDKAMSVLFRPVIMNKKEKYLIEDYESATKYDMSNTPLDVVFGSLVFFWDLKSELQKIILNYLQDQQEVEIPQSLLDSVKNGDGINPFTDLLKATSLKLMTLLKPISTPV
tara:strand:+ start:14550 stop:15221 length:672 start_codon:yes stop_codon:yes gene_type:complete